MRQITHVWLDERITFGPVREIKVSDVNDYLRDNDAQIVYSRGYGEPTKMYDRYEDVPFSKSFWYNTIITVVPRGTELWKMKGTEGGGRFIFPGQERPVASFYERLA